MQVFIIGSPLETAKALSPKHLNNQINECKIILDALKGAKAWRNHPVVLQYKGYEDWLELYTDVLTNYRDGDYFSAEIADFVAVAPKFHTKEFLTQMKRRLYTKNPSYYFQWRNLGKSNENWYFVDGVMRKYINGKRIE